jgi:hypothetical protein
VIAPQSTRDEASDPSTPCERLIALLLKHPDEVLRNPAFALAEIVVPGMASRFEESHWRAIVESRSADADWLRRAARRFGIPGEGRSWEMMSIEWDLACRADLPPDLLEAIAAQWNPDGVFRPGVELAARRLAADADPARDWRAAIPMAFLRTRRDSTISCSQAYAVLTRLLYLGALAPDSPVVEAFAAIGRWDGAREVAMAAGAENPMVAELWAYMASGRMRHRGADAFTVALRGMIRRWHNGGKLGPLPPRFRGVRFSGYRVHDPWDRPEERKRARDVVAAGRRQRRSLYPPVPRCVVTRALQPDAPIAHRFAVLSSTACPPDVLAAAAVSDRWTHRLCAAANPLTHPDARAALCEDVHLLVRGAARECGSSAGAE